MNEIAPYLLQVDELIKRQSASLSHPELIQIAEYALNNQGKRIRPRFCLIGSYLFTDDLRQAVGPAVALEIFHIFSLVHDDIMDEAPLRRGRSSIYARYGRDKAILSGDVLCILCQSILARQVPGRLLPGMLDIFHRASIDVCEGQMLDMDFEGHTFPSQQDYMKMIEGKTAVLIGASLQMGSMAGGASVKDAELLYQYGVLQGLIFQIQDDIIDVFGQVEQTGKQVGGDIIQGKKTLLSILCAFKSGEERHRFESIFFDHQMDAVQKVKLIKKAYQQFNVLEDAQMIKQSLSDQATQILNKVAVPAPRKQALVDWCRSLHDRVS